MGTLDDLPLAFPLCARCGHEVERVDRQRDPLVPGIVLTAHCHGSREHAWVTDSELHALLPGSVQLLPAFEHDPLQRDPRDFFREPGPYAPGSAPRYEPRVFTVPLSPIPPWWFRGF